MSVEGGRNAVREYGGSTLQSETHERVTAEVPWVDEAGHPVVRAVSRIKLDVQELSRPYCGRDWPEGRVSP